MAWVEAEAPHARVARFRRAFALVWLVYDLLDLVLGGTAARWICRWDTARRC